MASLAAIEGLEGLASAGAAEGASSGLSRALGMLDSPWMNVATNFIPALMQPDEKHSAQFSLVDG